MVASIAGAALQAVVVLTIANTVHTIILTWRELHSLYVNIHICENIRNKISSKVIYTHKSKIPRVKAYSLLYKT